MSELLLKVGAGSSYEDGDIVEAFNHRRILLTNAHNICHVKHAGFKTDGRRPDGLHRNFLELTYQYRFERVSHTEVLRTEIETGIGETLSSESIDVPLFVARRLQHQRHAIFGTPGAEVWYGGLIKNDQSMVDAIWAQIETHSAHKKADHYDWPLTDLELSHFLAVPTEDFTDAVARDLLAGETDNSDPENPILLMKRKKQVRYKEVLNLSELLKSKITNPNVKVDKLPAPPPFVLSNIVSVKQWLP